MTEKGSEKDQDAKTEKGDIATAATGEGNAEQDQGKGDQGLAE